MEDSATPPPRHATGAPHASLGKIVLAVSLGTALVAGAVIIAPYVLPYVGIGDSELALRALSALHGTGLGNGLAGVINTGLNAVPLIGPALAEGGSATALATGAVGIGGALLGHFVEKHDDGSSRIRWGRVIKYSALVASSLIALPSLLTGISVGVTYLFAAFSSVELTSQALTFMANTFGSMGAMNIAASGVGGVAAALPHLLACGAPLVPAVLSFGLAARKEAAPGDPPDSGFAGRIAAQHAGQGSHAHGL